MVNKPVKNEGFTSFISWHFPGYLTGGVIEYKYVANVRQKPPQKTTTTTEICCVRGYLLEMYLSISL